MLFFRKNGLKILFKKITHIHSGLIFKTKKYFNSKFKFRTFIDTYECTYSVVDFVYYIV